ncbi:GpE family phage tail protein [uncultured Pseudomonas sp.]|nr:GpE family phage tail protein [uncultured Pseudomonas sp.]APQ13407.1 hypothetical protein BJP27_18575 [Pseudomonas psychrotolerans]
MADLAITFHWPLDQLAAMSLAELMDWRERARMRAAPDGE